MKLKSGFVLHTVGGEYVVVPVDERTREFRGMIRLNASGAFLWEQMQGDFTREGMAQALFDRYDVSRELAAETVNKYIATLEDAGLIEA